MGNKVKQLLNQLIKGFKRSADKKQVKKDRYYHKYADYKSYGIGAPKRKTILKKFLNEFKKLNEKEVFDLVELLYSSRVEDQVLAGNYILALRIDLITPQKFGWLDKMLDYFMSWSTIDDFCVAILQEILLKYPKETLALLERWNKSKNMWKRRASVVAFVRKIGEGGKFTGIVLRLCNNLIWDSEDLVQKGVGWALKDNMRGNKEKVLRYIKDLRKKGVNSTIVLYAIRDLKGKERKRILKIASGRQK